ncbi:MAG: alpha/beta hydrolase [Alphaproteobacteria bacterium]|nr:alpha/beta hydrolase [Alphaproteobacteria bacterium]
MSEEEQRLAVRAAAPDWFHWAIAQQGQSRRVEVEGCSIHYLLWQPEAGVENPGGILFVHGGGAHAHWWSHIAPFFRAGYRVAAIDLSGMGDSGSRPEEVYNATLRAQEIHAVITDGGLGPRPFLVGHSFGGFMSMRYASLYGESLGGMVIADSPLRPPEEGGSRRRRASPMGAVRIYPDFEAAVARFRLRPRQICENRFIVEYIARHSIKAAEGGWCWKFDGNAMSGRRFAEPFHEHLQAANCRSALFIGADSALVTEEMARYTNSLMGPKAPLVVIPAAQHHLMLDQPLAFVAAVRTQLEGWRREDLY